MIERAALSAALARVGDHPAPAVTWATPKLFGTRNATLTIAAGDDTLTVTRTGSGVPAHSFALLNGELVRVAYGYRDAVGCASRVLASRGENGDVERRLREALVSPPPVAPLPELSVRAALVVLTDLALEGRLEVERTRREVDLKAPGMMVCAFLEGHGVRKLYAHDRIGSAGLAPGDLEFPAAIGAFEACLRFAGEAPLLETEVVAR